MSRTACIASMVSPQRSRIHCAFREICLSLYPVGFGKPSLVLADEPTSALDGGNRDSFLDLLFTEARSADTAIVLVSHDASLRPHFARHHALEGR